MSLEPALTNVNQHTTLVHFRQMVENQIDREMAEGNYKAVDDKPIIFSAQGPVPKRRDIRLIHDCRHPVGAAVNDYAMQRSLCLPNCYWRTDQD